MLAKKDFSSFYKSKSFINLGEQKFANQNESTRFEPNSKNFVKHVKLKTSYQKFSLFKIIKF